MNDPELTQQQMALEIRGLRQQLVKQEQLEAEYREARLVLWESQARVASILDIANEAIISIDERQRIILFNKGAERIFGYSPDEVAGQPLDILLPAGLAELHRRHVVEFDEASDSGRLVGDRQEIYGCRKNGERFPAEASISKLEIDGQQIFTAVLRDITERRQVEQEREARIIELRTLNEAARAISAELSREGVLQKITEMARDLVKTKYAALGVNDGQGQLSRFITAGIEPAVQAKIGPFPIGRGILGLLFHEGKSMIVNDIGGHPAAVGFPEHHPKMKALLGVPIFSKEELIGGLYLADKEDGSNFSETDRQLVEMLALHAATAIENSRLYEQTQRLAVFEERERFARDLHDGIIQSIYAVGLTLDQINVEISSLNTVASEQIDLSLKSLASVIQDLRNYIFDLRPQALKYQGLKARLEGLIRELRVNTLLPIETEISPDIDTCLSDMQARHVFHVSHEALANAARHAKASKISLSLTRNKNLITLAIQDDGIGFEMSPSIKPGRRGLANMKARAAEVGARFKIDSAPHQGTCLTLIFRCGVLPES